MFIMLENDIFNIYRIRNLVSYCSYTLNALLNIINSGPVVKFPTIIDLELAIIPDAGYGIPPLIVTGSTLTFKISDIDFISSSLALG